METTEAVRLNLETVLAKKDNYKCADCGAEGLSPPIECIAGGGGDCCNFMKIMANKLDSTNSQVVFWRSHVGDTYNQSWLCCLEPRWVSMTLGVVICIRCSGTSQPPPPSPMVLLVRSVQVGTTWQKRAKNKRHPPFSWCTDLTSALGGAWHMDWRTSAGTPHHTKREREAKRYSVLIISIGLVFRHERQQADQ